MIDVYEAMLCTVCARTVIDNDFKLLNALLLQDQHMEIRCSSLLKKHRNAQNNKAHSDPFAVDGRIRNRYDFSAQKRNSM